MPLDGPAFAAWAARWTTFIGGKTPAQLVAVEGGAVVNTGACNESFRVIYTENGVVRVAQLDVTCAERLKPPDRYTYNAQTWQVTETGYDKLAGTDWPHWVRLERQVTPR